MPNSPVPALTRLGLLTAQYTVSYDHLYNRLQGLTDEEYFWEPTKNCWNLGHYDQLISSKVRGKGPWRMIEYDTSPDPAPFTTIAWRLCHLVAWQMIRYDYTFGNKSLTWNDLELPGTANEAHNFLESSHRAWQSGLASLTDSHLDIVGLSSNPWGLDPKLPFGDIFWWTNREFIHHSAEICLLRDLWRTANHSG